MQSQLISVIRHSLTAAQSALQALEYVEGNCEVQASAVVEVAPAPAPAPAQAAWPFPTKSDAQSVPEVPTPLSQFGRLMLELHDDRYTLRSLNELCEETGIESHEGVYAALRDNSIEYVRKHRRSDGAALVGLRSRN